MRRALIVMLAVLILALGLSGAGYGYLCASVDAAEALRAGAVLAADRGDPDRAAQLLTQLAELWEKRRPILEMIAPHDALHEARVAIVEAKICLECGDHDDFLRTAAVAAESLAHIRDEEAVSFENLY